MIRALYTAASGMVAQSIKQDVIANNIANAQTPGFKRERVVSTSFQQTLLKTVAEIEAKKGSPYPGSPVQAIGVSAQSTNDASEGPIRATGNALQFAIEGPGTFEIGSGDSARQTRNGSFVVDDGGELATTDGEKVQGKSGAIKVPSGDWTVTPDGAILSKGAEIDKIKINGAEPSKTRVMQGSLEESNVSIIREMVDMIANLRR